MPSEAEQAGRQATQHRRTCACLPPLSANADCITEKKVADRKVGRIAGARKKSRPNGRKWIALRSRVAHTHCRPSRSARRGSSDGRRFVSGSARNPVDELCRCKPWRQSDMGRFVYAPPPHTPTPPTGGNDPAAHRLRPSRFDAKPSPRGKPAAAGGLRRAAPARGPPAGLRGARGRRRRATLGRPRPFLRGCDRLTGFKKPLEKISHILLIYPSRESSLLVKKDADKHT